MTADDIEGEQHVGDPRIRHHLGFAELLHSNAPGAQFDLVLGQRHELVGLDVGAIGEARLVAARLPAGEIALDDIDVDHRHRGLEILDAAANIFELKVAENIHHVTPVD